MDKYLYTFGTGGRLWLVTFHFNRHPVVCNDAGFKDTLERYDNGHGIESVKWLDRAKWIRAAKQEIRQVLSYDTETDLYLEEHYYFKKR